MIGNDLLQMVLYVSVLLLCVKPMGWYIAAVYAGRPCGLDRLLGPVERLLYRCTGIQPTEDMHWKTYLTAMLAFNVVGCFLVYLIARLQAYLPFNPEHLPAVQPDLAFNIATAFVTTTDWQAYGGENTLSYFTQMLALGVQNFLGAATGMSLLMAFIRGLVRQEATGLGNFWVDTWRGVLYILLPLSFIVALILVSQGVIQNFNHYLLATPLQSASATQLLPMGPVASQTAIMELGGNGGGFFNVNSAHPFQNPTPFSNFIEMLSILLLPAAICYSFGVMVNDRKQGWALLVAMFLVFLPWLAIDMVAEQRANPLLITQPIDQTAHDNTASGGNMEGKETRFGIASSVIWASAATATSNGSTNAMFDSFTPLGVLSSLWLMDLGEVIFGGVGSGLYGMLILVMITVFVAGLMVGRTPEYLGKKIEPYEMKMAAFAILVMPVTVLCCTAIAVVAPAGLQGLSQSNSHGFTEILYAFTSLANNNGSAMGGLNANSVFYNTVGGVVMLMGRYLSAIAAIAIAGSMVRKRVVPVSLGTLPTFTPLFIVLLIAVITVVGALTFFPALALGPVVEALQFVAGN